MKSKVLKSILLIFGIALVFTSGAAVAITLSAKDIGFKSTNEEWQASNVEDAVNDLYKMGFESPKFAEGDIAAVTTQFTEYDIGFKPKYLLLFTNTNYGGYTGAYDVENGKYYITYSDYDPYYENDKSDYIQINDNGFSIKAQDLLFKTGHYWAIG